MIRRKPTTVEVFKLSKDFDVIAPDWVGKAIKNGDILIDRRIKDGAVKLFGCAVILRNGTLKASIGDYLIKDGAAIYPISAKDYEKYFEEVKAE